MKSQAPVLTAQSAPLCGIGTANERSGLDRE
jgi:hypothetical protein